VDIIVVAIEEVMMVNVKVMKVAIVVVVIEEVMMMVMMVNVTVMKVDIVVVVIEEAIEEAIKENMEDDITASTTRLAAVMKLMAKNIWVTMVMMVDVKVMKDAEVMMDAMVMMVDVKVMKDAEVMMDAVVVTKVTMVMMVDVKVTMDAEVMKVAKVMEATTGTKKAAKICAVKETSFSKKSALMLTQEKKPSRVWPNFAKIADMRVTRMIKTRRDK